MAHPRRSCLSRQWANWPENTERCHGARLSRFRDGLAELDPLQAELAHHKRHVTNTPYIPDCKTWSKADRVTNGIYFSGHMTTYIQLLGSLRKGMVCKIVAELKQVSSRCCDLYGRAWYMRSWRKWAGEFPMLWYERKGMVREIVPELTQVSSRCCDLYRRAWYVRSQRKLCRWVPSDVICTEVHGTWDRGGTEAGEFPVLLSVRKGMVREMAAIIMQVSSRCCYL